MAAPRWRGDELEAGKLGDLVVFRSDRLVHIRNTATIQYVMKGGALYDANSLDEPWPRARKARRPRAPSRARR